MTDAAFITDTSIALKQFSSSKWKLKIFESTFSCHNLKLCSISDESSKLKNLYALQTSQNVICYLLSPFIESWDF